MKKILLLSAALLLASCTQGDMPAPVALDTTRPTGISRDFVALYESREGNLVSTTEIAQSGTGIVLRKKSPTQTATCSNITGTGTLLCRSGSGALLSSEDSEKLIRVEALTSQRLLGRHRILGDDIKAVARQIPSNLAVFKKDGFTTALANVAGAQPEATLTSCFEKTTTEEKEFYCFGGDFMPYWADTTFTPIGNIVLMRSLKAYSQVTLSPEQMRTLLRSLE